MKTTKIKFITMPATLQFSNHSSLVYFNGLFCNTFWSNGLK